MHARAGLTGCGRRSPGSRLAGGGAGRPRPRRLRPRAALAAARARSGSAGRRIGGGCRDPLSRGSGGGSRPGDGRPAYATTPGRAGARRSARGGLRTGCPGAERSGSRGIAPDLLGGRAGGGDPRAPSRGRGRAGSRCRGPCGGRRGTPGGGASRCGRGAARGPPGSSLPGHDSRLRSGPLGGRRPGAGWGCGRGSARRRVSPRPLLAGSRRLRRHQASLAPRARDRPPDPVRKPLRPPG
jgi:hypothetical protein